jgi:hypothetical protein
MAAALAIRPLVARVWDLRQYVPAIATLALALAVAILIVLSYFGEGRSPYGNCFAPNGRPMPCELVQKSR